MVTRETLATGLKTINNNILKYIYRYIHTHIHTNIHTFFSPQLSETISQ